MYCGVSIEIHITAHHTRGRPRVSLFAAGRRGETGTACPRTLFSHQLYRRGESLSKFHLQQPRVTYSGGVFLMRYVHFADFDPSRASRFGRGGRLLVTARDNGSILRKEIFDDIAYLDFLVHNISIEWKGQRLQYRDICSTWRGKCWKNEVNTNQMS